MDLATGSSLVILTRVYNSDWGWLRNEREGGNGESKLTTFDKSYCEREKSWGCSLELWESKEFLLSLLIFKFSF